MSVASLFSQLSWPLEGLASLVQEERVQQKCVDSWDLQNLATVVKKNKYRQIELLWLDGICLHS
jgi:hypothetical protein